jgi:perosamine synthetase
MRRVAVNEPLLDGNEAAYLQECIATGWISSDGPFVERFETSFAARVGRRYGIAVCNGSFALDVAVAALGIGPGDEVIMPTFTIISCAAAIVRAGAKPVLVDCDPDDWNMRVSDIEALITPRTRAIMPVHIYGLPVDMDPLLQIARKHKLAVIEDAAEMHGQTYHGKPCGSFGDISTFSFYPNKHVTTGEGGMVVTDDDHLASRLRKQRNLCFESERRFLHRELGWNLRMSNLQAAVGLAQLERLDQFVVRKREIGRLYRAKLAVHQLLALQPEFTESAENIYWVNAIVLSPEVPGDAKSMADSLGAHGVGTRPFFWPMHQQPVFHDMGLFLKEKHPHAENIALRGFYLPSGLALHDDDVTYCANKLLETLSGANA